MVKKIILKLKKKKIILHIEKKKIILHIEKKIILVVERKQIHLIFGMICFLMTAFLIFETIVGLPAILSINGGLLVAFVIVDLLFLYATIANLYEVYKQSKEDRKSVKAN